jgi:hypothetical protein
MSTRPDGVCAAQDARSGVRSPAAKDACGWHERELLALLGDDFTGTCTSDRWWAHTTLDLDKRQVCWSQLARDFTAYTEDIGARKASRWRVSVLDVVVRVLLVRWIGRWWRGRLCRSLHRSRAGRCRGRRPRPLALNSSGREPRFERVAHGACQLKQARGLDRAGSCRSRRLVPQRAERATDAGLRGARAAGRLRVSRLRLASAPGDLVTRTRAVDSVGRRCRPIFAARRVGRTGFREQTPLIGRAPRLTSHPAETRCVTPSAAAKPTVCRHPDSARLRSAIAIV